MTNPTINAENLLPCPFCGATLYLVGWHKTLLSDHKHGCYLQGRPQFLTDNLTAWNMRTQFAPCDHE